MSGFTAAQRRIILARDVYCVPHAGQCPGPYVLHHRRNRGMGGDPTADRVANGLVVCHDWNTAVEQRAGLAGEARAFGWKLPAHADPAGVAVYLPEIDGWALLDDAGRYLDPQGAPFAITRV